MLCRTGQGATGGREGPPGVSEQARVRFGISGLAGSWSAGRRALARRLASVMPATESLKVRVVMIVAGVDVVDLVSRGAALSAGRVAGLALVTVTPQHADPARRPVGGQALLAVAVIPSHYRVTPSGAGAGAAEYRASSPGEGASSSDRGVSSAGRGALPFGWKPTGKRGRSGSGTGAGAGVSAGRRSRIEKLSTRWNARRPRRKARCTAGAPLCGHKKAPAAQPRKGGKKGSSWGGAGRSR